MCNNQNTITIYITETLRKCICVGIASITLAIIASCGDQQADEYNYEITSYDYTGPLYFVDAVTNDTLNQINLERGTSIVGALDVVTPSMVDIVTNKTEKAEALIILPKSKIKFQLSITDTSIVVSDTVMSIIKLLNQDMMAYIHTNQSKIFLEYSPEKTLSDLDSISRIGKNTISTLTSGLGDRTTDFVKFHYNERLNSFLFYLGRNIKNLPASHEYFSFSEAYNVNEENSRSYPWNTLYSIELDYLKNIGPIKDISKFRKYVIDKVSSKDLSDYLVAVYISNLIEMPTYWSRQQELITAESLDKLFEDDLNNKYRSIYERALKVAIALKNNQSAENIYGIDLVGDTMNTQQITEGFLVVDFWATWCGPCLDQEAAYSEMAAYFDDTSEIKFIKASIDDDYQRWSKFMKERDRGEVMMSLWLDKLQRKLAREDYLVTSIPRYILIDPDNNIVNANLPAPSDKVRAYINTKIKEYGSQ